MGKMPYKIFGFEKFMEQFINARLLFLKGQKGTGKTLFATALGYHLLKEAYAVNAAFNYPCSFAGYPAYNQTYGVVDEAGVFFDARSAYKDKDVTAFISEATTFLRKRGSFLVIPSYNPPDKRLRSGMRMFRWKVTKRMWFYQWEIGPEEVNARTHGVDYFRGRLVLFNPQFFYGVYDTYFEPPELLTLRWIKDFLTRPYMLPDYIKF